jgi:uncharacterized membrane protein YfcA
VARSSIPVLVGIGLVAGLFSTLFGVGGGVIVVPLLIMLLSFDPKPATGTSLAAIGITAAFGTLAYALRGRVEWDAAAMIGLPAVLGGLAGTWLQQRISSRLLVLLFAGFLVATAVRLFVE